MSFRNRCVIGGANGPIILSIPISGGRDQRTTSKDVKIDYSVNWQKQHLKSIVSAYNRSPFFEYYREDVLSLFGKKFVKLYEWNLVWLEWFKDVTGLQWEYSFTETYYNRQELPGITDLRDRFEPKTAGQSGKDILTYRQVFEEKIGHINGLSMLDTLFCAGPAAIQKVARESQD